MNFLEPSVVDMERLAKDCEKEEIRFTGFTQGHGVFFAIDRLGICVAASENAVQAGIKAETVLQRDFFSFFKELLPFRDQLQTLLPEMPRKLGDFRLGQRVWSVVAIQSGELVFMELEPVREATGQPTKVLTPSLFVPHDFTEASEAYSVLVQDVQKAIGYDHVMLYQFQMDGSGEVVAEERGPDAPIYLGHRFPASDIPQIARDLYMKTVYRQIVNIHERPVPIRTVDEHGLDLTHSYLRSVSPIHLEYLRNMKVASAFSVPIIVSKQLWGLVTTHAYTPQSIPFEVRIQVAETVRNFSVTLRTMKILEENRWHMRLAQRMLSLADDLVWKEDTSSLSEAGTASICDILGLCGFVMISGNEINMFGRGPSVEHVQSLVDNFCYDRTRPLFTTDNIRKRFRYYRDWPLDIGALIIVQNNYSVSEKRWQYIFIGFRSEVLQTVTWAGNPNRHVEAGPPGSPPQPRRSFASWIEERRGFSISWTHIDRIIAQRLVSYLFRAKSGIQRPRFN